jgi:amino acid permease
MYEGYAPIHDVSNSIKYYWSLPAAKASTKRSKTGDRLMYCMALFKETRVLGVLTLGVSSLKPRKTREFDDMYTFHVLFVAPSTMTVEPNSAAANNTSDVGASGRVSMLTPLLNSSRHIDASSFDGEENNPILIISERMMGEGTASMTTVTFNLIKNVVGSGMLTLPSGVAAFANAPSALWPASAFTLITGAIFGYYFLLIGRTCRISHTSTYREAWEATMGHDSSALFVALINTLKPALGTLTYSMILADTFRSLFSSILVWDVSRVDALLIITLVAILPLCLLKNLSVLAPTSFIGTAGFFFTTIVMGVRYFDGSYTEGGQFFHHVPDHFKPSFGSKGASGAWSPQVFVLLVILFEAFVAHYNAPRFYSELKNHTISRFAHVVSYSFIASSVTYVLVTVFGFLTFGEHCDGFVINNYANNDNLVNACRGVIAIAVVCTYPVAFMGVRDGALALFRVSREEANLNVVSIILLSVITFVASICSNLGLVNAIGGGTLGTIVVFIFPSLMFRSSLRRFKDTELTKAQAFERVFVLVLMWVGILMGAIGVWMAVI